MRDARRPRGQVYPCVSGPMRLASERVQLHQQVHEKAWFRRTACLCSPRSASVGSGSHFSGSERKKEIFNNLMARMARDCEPASAELYILVRAGWNLAPGPCEMLAAERKMARLHAEQQPLTLLQTEAVTFRDVLPVCHCGRICR